MRNCPACGAGDPRALITRIPIARPVGVPGDQEIRVYACGTCGMGYSDDGVTQEALDAYYARLGKYGDLGVYAAGGDHGLGTEAPWEVDRARALAAFIARHAPRTARVMDAGCSTGTLLLLLAEHGFTSLTGLEPLPGAVAIARDGRGLDVEEGWITSIAPGTTYDVIVVSHVLEHVLELREALHLMHSRLAPGGLLVAEVPDAHRFHQHIHIPYQDFNTEHINHFSPAILSAAVQSSGFDELEVQPDMAGAGPDHPYPVVRGAWRKADHMAPVVAGASEADAHRGALHAYAAGSEALFEQVDERTQALVGDQPFAIWGSGQFTMKWVRREAFPAAGLSALVDSAASRHGLIILGHEVMDPAHLAPGDWPPVVLAGSAYAAAAISRAATARGITARVASPFADRPDTAPRSRS